SCLSSSTQARQVAQRREAREEEICAAGHGNELRHVTQAQIGAALLRHGKVARYGATGNRLSVAQQWVAFLRQTTEFGSSDPRRLHELELAGDVGAQAYKPQADLCTRCAGL